MIRATPAGSYGVEQGDRGVRVGVLDTGIDGTHPDIAPNFDAALSRNFTVDIPLVDGPCADEADGSCNDPANVDENGHGTHVAGTIASPLDGFGMAGVAPNVTLVNLRAGQDSGYFFLQPSVDALTFAADNGIDVVNMSYFIDPWLYNCSGNPADSATASARAADDRRGDDPRARLRPPERRHARRRGRERAHRHGQSDDRHDQPGLPARRRVHPHRRQLVPDDAERGAGRRHRRRRRPEHVQGRLLELGRGGNRRHRSGRLLPRPLRDARLPHGRDPGPGAVPAQRRDRRGTSNPDGTPNTPFVVRYCQGATVRLLPVPPGHVDGLPARGRRRGADRQPLRVPGSAAGRAGAAPAPDGEDPLPDGDAARVPDPPVLDYTNVGRPPSYTATCIGTAEENSIWGAGIVDALTAVTDRNG